MIYTRILEMMKTALMTKELTQGVLVYYSKTADVKTWVVNDVINTLD